MCVKVGGRLAGGGSLHRVASGDLTWVAGLEVSTFTTEPSLWPMIVRFSTDGVFVFLGSELSRRASHIEKCVVSVSSSDAALSEVRTEMKQR